VHESLRVFADRLTDDTDRNWFFDLAKTLTEKHFKEKFSKTFARLDNNKVGQCRLTPLKPKLKPSEIKRL
jgi:dynein heavy chain